MILSELLAFVLPKLLPGERVSVGHTMQSSGYQTVHICVHVEDRIDRSMYTTGNGDAAMAAAVARIELGEWERVVREPAIEPQAVGL